MGVIEDNLLSAILDSGHYLNILSLAVIAWVESP